MDFSFCFTVLTFTGRLPLTNANWRCASSIEITIFFMAFTYSVLYAEGLIMTAILAQRLQTAKNTLTARQRYWSIGHNRIVNRCFSLNQQVIINPIILCKIIAKLLDFWTDMLYLCKAIQQRIHTTNWAVLIRADSSAFSLRRVTTFFECEMNIPFNKIVSESKNMESLKSAFTKNSHF